MKIIKRILGSLLVTLVFIGMLIFCLMIIAFIVSLLGKVWAPILLIAIGIFIFFMFSLDDDHL